MLINQKVQDIVADLKAYLEYLKGMGIEVLPVAEAKVEKMIPSDPPTLEEIRRELGDSKRPRILWGFVDPEPKD